MEINFDIVVGFKHPDPSGGNGSLRHEWSLLNGFEQTTTYTVSRGGLEIIGFQNDPTFTGQDPVIFNPDLSKIGGLKYDKPIVAYGVPLGV